MLFKINPSFHYQASKQLRQDYFFTLKIFSAVLQISIAFFAICAQVWLHLQNCNFKPIKPLLTSKISVLSNLQKKACGVITT